MQDLLMDFRFGWRWLLPRFNNARMRLFGFSNEEASYLRKTMSSLLLCDTNECYAEMLLINAVRSEVKVEPRKTEITRADVICVVANRAGARHWMQILRGTSLHVREYGLLPLTQPRVVVPLDSALLALAGLGLHRPGRWLARQWIKVAKMLLVMGNSTMLRGRVLLIATRSPEFIPNGVAHAELKVLMRDDPIDFALYLGTADDNRKTVVLPVGDSPSSTVLKVAQSVKARQSILNEAAALKFLSMTVLSEFVPRLEHLATSDDALTIYQEYRPRCDVSEYKLNQSVIEFLARLSELNGESKLLSFELARIPDCFGSDLTDAVRAACLSLLRNLKERAENGAKVWLCRTHGDLAPWNCQWTDQGLFVFDWEASQEQDLVFGDLFYYAIAPALLVKRNTSAKRTLQSVLRMAKQLAQMIETDLDVKIHLALWLLSRVNESIFYGELVCQLERCEW